MGVGMGSMDISDRVVRSRKRATRKHVRLSNSFNNIYIIRRDWIDMGEKRNSYIPARPDEYYENLGQWKSWDHFLGLSGDDDAISEFE